MLKRLRPPLQARPPDESHAMVFSFDVFDTCLTRLVGQPSSLFLVLGHSLVAEGAWQCSAHAFANARIASERRARSNTSAQEVTLDGIYAEMAHAYGLDERSVCLLAASELRMEKRLLRPMPRALEIISKLRAQQERIIFISDTYLPLQEVESWLREFGLAADGDRVWASSAVRLTKQTGDLFRFVLDHDGIDPNFLRHTGDNAISDGIVPAELGIRTSQFDDCRLTRYQMIMQEFAEETAGVASLFAGASRWARLTVPASTEDMQKLRDLATQVAGPVLCAYVAWVLLKAKSIGLRKLLFTSRDGQVMLKVAERLKVKLATETELVYFYGGRQVFNLAGLERVNAQAIEWITESAAVLTLSDILQRVDLDASEVIDEIEEYALPHKAMLGPDHLKTLADFLSDPRIAEKICRSAVCRRRRMLAYLEACGLSDVGRCGIIDIGWRGRVFHAIREVLPKMAGDRHIALYFGLFAKPTDIRGLDAFLFDQGASPPLGLGADIPSLANVMEIFCQADHGPVVDVIQSGSGYIPVLKAETKVNPQWDIPYFHRCIEAFVEALQITPESFPNPDLRPMCERLLRTLMTSPSVEEAAFLGAFKYNTDQGAIVQQPFAEPYRVGDFRYAFRHGVLPEKQHVWWHSGALALSSPTTLRLLRLARQLSRVRSAGLLHGLRAALDRFRRYWRRR